MGDPDEVGDIFVIAADISVADPVKSARNTVFVAHDLSALEDEPITRIVHGVVREAEAVNGRTEQARRLIESVASASRIEQYSWDNSKDREAFVSVTRTELARMGRGKFKETASIGYPAHHPA